jgi:hypothetical protein
MNQRHTTATLTPVLALVVLVAFGLSGLMTGVLAHGFVASLAVTPVPTPRPTATHPPEHPQPTATPVAVAPTVHFNLSLAAQPQRVAPGDTVTLVASATAKTTGFPVARLLCTLGVSPLGGVPLLSTWPAPTTTNDQGRAAWQVRVPPQPGTYTVAVSATGPDQFKAWAYASVYVSG